MGHRCPKAAVRQRQQLAECRYPPRQLTGSLIAVPMLTMATSQSHYLRPAIEPSCSEAAAREYRRPARSGGWSPTAIWCSGFCLSGLRLKCEDALGVFQRIPSARSVRPLSSRSLHLREHPHVVLSADLADVVRRRDPAERRDQVRVAGGVGQHAGAAGTMSSPMATWSAPTSLIT